MSGLFLADKLTDKLVSVCLIYQTSIIGQRKQSLTGMQKFILSHILNYTRPEQGLPYLRYSWPIIIILHVYSNYS